MGSDINHAYTDYLVISEGLRQRNDHNNKGYRLLAHAEHSSEKAEKKHHQDNNDIPYSKLPHNCIFLQ